MLLRWKLFILLLFFAAAPMLAGRLYNASAFMEMRGDLVRQTNATLVERARQAVSMQVLDHARHVRLQEELLELAVQMQATGLAWGENDSTVAPGASARNAPAHRMRGPGGMLLRPGMLYHPPGAAPSPANGRDENASRLEPVFEAVAARFGERLLWQAACLPGASFVVFPPPANAHDDSALLALLNTLPASDQPFWSDPFVDPRTGQLALAVSMGNATAGFAVCAVNGPTLLHGGGHLDNLSPRLETMLVRPAAEGQGITVLAVQDRAAPSAVIADGPAGGWRQRTKVLDGAGLLEDIQAERAGTAILQHGDEPDAPALLWAYAPLGRERLSLLASLPLDDVTSETKALKAFIDHRLADLRTFSASSYALLMVLAFFCSLIVSRRMQLRVVRLLQGFAQVAQGNFGVRLDVRSRDELGQLARSFNAMVPALEERLQIMEALDLAHTMQQRLLPLTPPNVPGLELAGACLYCEATGGDFYDYLTPSGRALDVVVGDVSGHGLSAALLMATTRACLRQRAALRSMCCGEVRLACNVNDVNRQLCRDLSLSGNFVTLACLRIVPRTGEMTWIRAGHDPALLYDPVSGAMAELCGAGIPLGVEESWRYEEQTMQLPVGHILAIGTDGIWEAQNPAGERYGKARFREAFQRLATSAASLQHVLDGLLLDLEVFRQGARQEDDVTLVLLRRKSLDLAGLGPEPDPEPEPDCPDHPDNTTCSGGCVS
ncbi:PP2C family protein-serine/threonine phosphatase [Megalodesulfovibrio paquesii]